MIITPFICLVLVSIFRIEDRTAEIELSYCSSASAKDKDQVLPGSFPKSTHMWVLKYFLSIIYELRLDLR